MDMHILHHFQIYFEPIQTLTSNVLKRVGHTNNFGHCCYVKHVIVLLTLDLEIILTHNITQTQPK